MLQGRYERIKKIGEGSYGVVYKAIDHMPQIKTMQMDQKIASSIESLAKALERTSVTKSQMNSENSNPNSMEDIKMPESKGKIVAVKKLLILGEENEPNYGREIEFLKKLNHQNIVKLLDVFKKNQNLFLVLEYLETDLEKIIAGSKSPIPQHQIASYLKQILECVSYLHENKILHRDLKPSNMFVSKDGILKCGDFGIARNFAKKDEILTKSICTRYFSIFLSSKMV